MLNRLWLSFFVIAFISCLYHWLWLGDLLVFERVVKGIFDMSKTTVSIAIGLIGALSFWLGMFKIAEKAGMIEKIAWALTPLFHRLMPGVPANHPAIGSMTMNLSANMLGLDNAATPMGIKAMQDLQTLNKQQETATDAQILFLVLNTSSVTLFPIAVFVYRAQQGAASPTDVFLPILLATCASTLVGLMVVSMVQRIRLFNAVILMYFAAFAALIVAMVSYFSMLSQELLSSHSALLSNFLIFGFIIMILLLANRRKVNVYDSFVEGAKSGFELAVSLIPYLLAMLVAIAVLRASGVLAILVDSVRYLVVWLGFDSGFVEALPTAMMKPFSGSGARAMMVDTMATYGADSFVGRVASVIQGSTETTFYVIAVYFGAVGIKRTRHAIPCGLAADFAGIVAAILVCYWFFS